MKWGYNGCNVENITTGIRITHSNETGHRGIIIWINEDYHGIVYTIWKQFPLINLNETQFNYMMYFRNFSIFFMYSCLSFNLHKMIYSQWNLNLLNLLKWKIIFDKLLNLKHLPDTECAQVANQCQLICMPFFFKLF